MCRKRGVRIKFLVAREKKPQDPLILIEQALTKRKKHLMLRLLGTLLTIQV